MKDFICQAKISLGILILPSLLVIASCKKDTGNATLPIPQADTVIITPPADTLSYKLVWSDEFDGNQLNTADWNFETGGSGWGNNEKEFYQADNATVLNGNLVITAKNENAGTNNYTSARMTTFGKHEFTYGRIEGRIKIPLGQGLWPAFWMLGANIQTVSWPACGEIDIFEHINTNNLFYGTMHWNNNGYASYGGNTSVDPSVFHVYSIEWTSAVIRWYVDGAQYHEANIAGNINGTEEFHKPFFIILNLAVGGNWPRQIIDESVLPARLEVDYVRVYQKL